MKHYTYTEFHSELPIILEENENEVYSIRIVQEDDNTFDIRIWDEKENEAAEDLEEGHFPEYNIANKRLLEIVRDNKDVVFLRLPDEF